MIEPVNSRVHERRQRRVERGDVERDDRRVGRGQPRDEAVADFAAGAGDQDDRLPHVREIVIRGMATRPRRHRRRHRSGARRDSTGDHLKACNSETSSPNLKPDQTSRLRGFETFPLFQQRSERPPRFGILREQRVQVQRDAFGRVLLRDLRHRRAELLGIGRRESSWIRPFSCAMPSASRNAPIIGRCSAR